MLMSDTTNHEFLPSSVILIVCMVSGLAIEEKSIAVMNYFHPCYALLFNLSRIHSGPVFAGLHFPSMELQSCLDTRRTSNHVPGILLYLLAYLTTYSSHRNNG